MIFDNIANAEKYQNDTRLYAALIALRSFVNGESYEATSVIAFNKQECNTNPMNEAKLENHRRLTDIHYVIKGSEKILINYSSQLSRLTEYSEKKDCELFALSGEEQCVELQEGDFVVVYPGESHAPKVAINDEIAPISKVVVKI